MWSRISASLGRAGTLPAQYELNRRRHRRGAGKQKTAAPVGDERCPARGTTPLRRALAGHGLSPCRYLDTAGSLTGTAPVAAY